MSPIRRKSIFVLFLALALRAPLSAALADEIPDLRPKGVSLSPFFGRDDKNGTVYGFGTFFYRDRDPGYTVNLYGVSNLGDFFSGTLAHENWSPGPWTYQTLTTVERAFDVWYGEGDATVVNDPFKPRVDRVAFQGSARYRVLKGLSLGPLVEFRQRREWSVRHLDGDASEVPHLFPDESAWGLGLMAVADSRDSRLFPSRGVYAALKYRFLPSGWAFLPQDRALSQAEAEARLFHPLPFDCVAAARLMGGASWGDPGYQWRYRLGGVEQLRGYGDNRFRGRHFWLGQAELRFPVYKIVTGAVSADLGDTLDPGFIRPRTSAQAGLRLALPPDWGMRARFEFGWGEDQNTFNVQFGEVF